MSSFQDYNPPTTSSHSSLRSKWAPKVFEVVKKIPKGKVSTYKIVAQKAGHPKAYRAVGNILNRVAGGWRPKIPCHRVIRANGKVGGYNKGTTKKITLLKKEGIIIKNGKITSRATK